MPHSPGDVINKSLTPPSTLTQLRACPYLKILPSESPLIPENEPFQIFCEISPGFAQEGYVYNWPLQVNWKLIIFLNHIKFSVLSVLQVCNPFNGSTCLWLAMNLDLWQIHWHSCEIIKFNIFISFLNILDYYLFFMYILNPKCQNSIQLYQLGKESFWSSSYVCLTSKMVESQI